MVDASPVSPPGLPAFLACPQCRGSLLQKAERLECRSCHATYGTRDNVPLLFAPDAVSGDLIAVQTLYDEVADHYDAVFASHIIDHYLTKRVSVVRASADGPRLLDVGCGTGALGGALAESGYEVFGVDVSPQMLAEAGRRGLAGVYAASAVALPFTDGCFDFALSVAALHHFATPERVAGTIAEMARVVRPGGEVLLWDHNPLNPYWPNLMKRVPQDSGAERLVPLQEILSDLHAVGLVPIKVRRLGLVPEFVPASLMPLARAVERLVERTPLLSRVAAHNVVIARKPDI